MSVRTRHHRLRVVAGVSHERMARKAPGQQGSWGWWGVTGPPLWPVVGGRVGRGGIQWSGWGEPLVPIAVNPRTKTLHLAHALKGYPDYAKLDGASLTVTVTADHLKWLAKHRDMHRAQGSATAILKQVPAEVATT